MYLVRATISLATLAFSGLTQANPTPPRDHPFADLGYSRTNNEGRDASIPLRILPLGASIMFGVGSSSKDGVVGNGLWTQTFEDALRQDGYEVNMVGSLSDGWMKDNNHEANPGDLVNAILSRVPNSVGYKVTQHCDYKRRHHDGNFNVDISTIGTRMGNILNALWTAPDMSETCLMLSTLLPTENPTGKGNRDAINKQYRELVSTHNKTKCIYLADMDHTDGRVWFNFETDYMDGEQYSTHPNDKGHRMMASVFYQAITKALGDGKVQKPADIGEGGQTGCDKVADTGIDAGGLTQRGSDNDDGDYHHDMEEMGILFTKDSDWDRNQWRFAHLFDQKYDDLVAWLQVTDSSQEFVVWANSADGKGGFNAISNMVPNINCVSADGVNFIDMNGDGLDDLVYIDAYGNAFLSINQGDGNRATGKPPTFKSVSSTGKIKENEGYARDKVRVADIDGDGRGDYGVWDCSGWKFWRNGWVDDIPKYWQALGVTLKGLDVPNIDGYIFADINGDGRDDVVWLDENGAGYMQTNSRSCLEGKEGDGLKVAWRSGYFQSTSDTKVYKGMGSFATDKEKNLLPRIHFARIFGQSTVFGNLPKQDYVFIQHTKLDSGKHRFQMRVWRNKSTGGTKVLVDGNKYCNMVGHSNGMVDYVWTWSTGKMELYENRGKGHISDSDSDGYWATKGTIWTPPNDIHRRDLHLQDWDGDGDCDIIYVNPDGGSVQVWINNYPATGKWDWTHLENPAPKLKCSQKKGLGIDDLAVRFADITGNGRADYLCLEPNSKVTGFIQNSDVSFEDVGQIKYAFEKDRANLRWADVNGDGKDDLLWVDKFNGDAYVWYNKGRGSPADLQGSSFSWGQQSKAAYAGNAAGTCEFWADLDGNGRADEHCIEGSFTNKARTWLNPSCGAGSDATGDDDTFAERLTAEIASYNS
ncbi:unnamed protein product [Clonostachys solani]|uniref:SGNH hydrolase-type esterase domain-containing protein n=1 Tax=Clonostachys solani TaxID=160281 RepID=A0A9N9ZEX9_9HYPO|nr:unnamed protein product [Clonostachys solani]